MEVNQTDFCLHFSCREESVSTVYVLLYVSAAAVVLLTVFGNLLIIISVCHFKQLHTPTNMLILSLAVSDFLIGALVMPTALIWMIESCWIFSSVYCVFSIFTSCFLTGISIFNVALIAVDRYFALSNPFLYTKAVSQRKMCVVVLCNWFLLLFYHFALQYFNGFYAGLVMCPRACFLLLDEAWSLVDLLTKFVFPCAVIVILYFRVFVIARKHATAIRDLNVQTKTQNSKNMTNIMKSERKAAKVLGIIVSMFLVCLFPYFIYSVLGSAIQVDEDSIQKVLMLLYLNSAINPVIYALFYPWFRKCVKLTLSLQIFNTASALINVIG